MDMRRVLWILGAFAGVLLAAGVTYAASSLSTQQIGISSEPVSAGEDLAPALTATPTPTPTPKRKQRRPKRTSTPTPTPTPAPRATATPTPVPTADDHGGGGDDRGGDDSSGKGSGRDHPEDD